MVSTRRKSSSKRATSKRARVEAELTEDQRAICERVKNAYLTRKHESGYRQVQFAFDTGLSQGYLSLIMSKRVAVSRRSLAKIAQALLSDPSDLDPSLREDERELAISQALSGVEMARRLSREIDVDTRGELGEKLKRLEAVLDSIGDSLGEFLPTVACE